MDPHGHGFSLVLLVGPDGSHLGAGFRLVNPGVSCVGWGCFGDGSATCFKASLEYRAAAQGGGVPYWDEEGLMRSLKRVT
jgi:hypothetical protein